LTFTVPKSSDIQSPLPTILQKKGEEGERACRSSQWRLT